ncbi:hypothetical protein BH24ACT24_BH24ACT24_04130 [soil metagenome]
MRARAVRRGLAGHVGHVLDGDRHPGQRPLVAGAAAGVGLFRLRARPLAEHDAKGVQGRVEARDPPEAGLDELARGDLARADERGLAGDSRED